MEKEVFQILGILASAASKQVKSAGAVTSGVVLIKTRMKTALKAGMRVRQLCLLAVP